MITNTAIYDDRDNNVKYKAVLDELFGLKLTTDEFNREFKKRTGHDEDIIDTVGKVTASIADPSLYRFHPIYDNDKTVIGGKFV